ncbi:hypothetical protein DMB37_04840 [Nocardia sp. CS682]|nr:hypothetical protein DMB37_04840 [Nocardia sp. CS682]
MSAWAAIKVAMVSARWRRSKTVAIQLFTGTMSRDSARFTVLGWLSRAGLLGARVLALHRYQTELSLIPPSNLAIAVAAADSAAESIQLAAGNPGAFELGASLQSAVSACPACELDLGIGLDADDRGMGGFARADHAVVARSAEPDDFARRYVVAVEANGASCTSRNEVRSGHAPRAGIAWCSAPRSTRFRGFGGGGC